MRVVVTCPDCLSRRVAAECLGVTRLGVRSLLRRGRLAQCTACGGGGVTAASVASEELWGSTVTAGRRWRSSAGDFALEVLIEAALRGIVALIGAIIDGL